MKKISITIILSFLMIGLIACSNDDSDNSDQSSDNETEVSNNQETNEKENKKKIDFDVKNKSEESESKKLEIETKKAVTSLASGSVEGEFYNQFSDDMVNMIKDAVQDGAEEELSDEELTEKFLNNYVQLSNRVNEFTDENGEIKEVVITNVSEDEIELEDAIQTTMDVNATIVAENDEELPLEMLFDITSGDYKYMNISSPRT